MGSLKVLKETGDLEVQRNSETVWNSLITIPTPPGRPAHRSQGSTSTIEPRAGALGDWGRRGPAAPRRQRGQPGFLCPPRPSPLAAAPSLPHPRPPSRPAGDREMTASATPRRKPLPEPEQTAHVTAAAHAGAALITQTRSREWAWYSVGRTGGARGGTAAWVLSPELP